MEEINSTDGDILERLSEILNLCETNPDAALRLFGLYSVGLRAPVIFIVRQL